ncbi:hypothetical protein VII00023_00730 [Vibrio ichthyoenteri ATCC 700023]|uniref:Uncharacterized protein n=1 Tax=Vibrio ichthyoenteri ATCC 700023 TaxID=870968 RepID=F9RXY5_9VIBR|nr:hypothetical protein VII00023_00730 [Vibrio ichthyoenteri ATCC 700023]
MWRKSIFVVVTRTVDTIFIGLANLLVAIKKKRWQAWKKGHHSER